MNTRLYTDIAKNALWKQNPGLVQLLGMCPLLAMSNSVVNAAGLGLATIFVMAVSSGMVAALRSLIPYEVRIPVYILIIAAMVTVLDMAMNAWLHQLYLVLGIFIPLIVTNCIVLARVEAFAAKNAAWLSAWDGALMGAGLSLVLVVLGFARELVGQGTLFSGIDTVIPGATAWQVFPEHYPGFLFAVLPPGAMIGLGFLIAANNAYKDWQEKRAQHQSALPPPAAAPALPH